MRFYKGSADYEVNWSTFQEMDEIIPMTRSERSALRNWARRGYDVDTNPWNYQDSEGYQLSYLEVYRLKVGYSSGPWDYWKGPERQPMWDETYHRFIPKDDYC